MADILSFQEALERQRIIAEQRDLFRQRENARRMVLLIGLGANVLRTGGWSGVPESLLDEARKLADDLPPPDPDYANLVIDYE